MDNLAQTTPSTAGTPTSAPADLTGQTLGDFRILRKLGQGGMGEVYLAEQVSLRRKVALKMLKPELAANQSALERFKREAMSVAQATHANIVQVYQVGEEQGHHYMSLEYVEGRNLRDFVARKGPPEVLLALSILRQVAAALKRASELGIIHRDVKPENILLTRKGEVKVADFGLSRVLEGEQPAVNLTQSGVTMGTPLYMSPEQVEGKPLDSRTDIYSLGITAYHMLAGEPPFKGASAFEVALQHVRNEAVPLSQVRPDLPADLCAVVHKMMAKNPDDRYQTGRDLLKDLSRLREMMTGQTGYVPLAATGFLEPIANSPGSGTVTASSPSSNTVLLPAPSRTWLLAILFLLTIGVAAGVGGGVAWMIRHDRSPADDEADRIELTPVAEKSLAESREKRLLDDINYYYLAPENHYPHPKVGAHDCLDYALPLLKQNRLDEAEALFKRMELIQKVELYSTIGTLGQAIVASLRDDFRRSNELFASLVSEKRKRPGDPPRPFGDARGRLLQVVVGSHSDFPKWVREALYRNQVNNKANFDSTVPNFFKTFLDRAAVKDKPVNPPKTTDRRPPME